MLPLLLHGNTEAVKNAPEVNSSMEKMILSLSDWGLKHGEFILGVMFIYFK